MRYVGWEDLGGRPNVIVDGYGTDGTVLTLSHWPGAGTPEDLADDLSTQIAFRYLDRPDLAVDAALVSNNHYDEDGLCGMYALIAPDDALARRELIIDVASAGDFGTFRDRNAARIAMALTALGDEERSTLDPETFRGPYLQTASRLYEETLARLPEMLDNPDQFKTLWEDEDAKLTHDEERVRSGQISIEERPDLDLAIVRVPDGSDECHPMAINNNTERHRILVLQGQRYTLTYRYETWVRYVSRPTVPRVDLGPLAKELTDAERTSARWSFDGVEHIVPRLTMSGTDESSIVPERFEAMVEGFLSRA